MTGTGTETAEGFNIQLNKGPSAWTNDDLALAGAMHAMILQRIIINRVPNHMFMVI